MYCTYVIGSYSDTAATQRCSLQGTPCRQLQQCMHLASGRRCVAACCPSYLCSSWTRRGIQPVPTCLATSRRQCASHTFCRLRRRFRCAAPTPSSQSPLRLPPPIIGPPHPTMTSHPSSPFRAVEHPGTISRQGWGPTPAAATTAAISAAAACHALWRGLRLRVVPGGGGGVCGVRRRAAGAGGGGVRRGRRGWPRVGGWPPARRRRHHRWRGGG